MSQRARPFNLTRVALVVLVGGGAIYASTEILARSSPQPKIARAARARGGVGARAASGTLDAGEARGAVDVSVGIASKPGETILIGKAPTFREFFRPLVGKQEPKKDTPPAPAVAPALPDTSTSESGSERSRRRERRESTPPGTVSPSDLTMLGVVEFGDEPQVLIKNRQTGQSRYFAKGEDAYGFSVGEIKATEVILARAGQNSTVRMSTDVIIEGPGDAASAGRSAFGGGAGFGRGFAGGPGGRTGFGGGTFGGASGANGFGGGGGRGQGNREGRGGGGRGENGGDGGSGSGGGFSTAAIFSLPTWTERLKKLEEVKSQLEPAQYERLHSFMEQRAKNEKK